MPRTTPKSAPTKKTPPHQRAVADARAALVVRLDYDSMLAKLGPKDRLNAQRHVTACEAEADPRHAGLWRQVACMLMTLAPHAAKLNGQQSAQFYVPDGKYRMQVFALEDKRDGNLTVYCGNVLDDAIAAGVIAPATPAAPGRRGAGASKSAADPDELPEGPVTYILPESGQSLVIEQLDGRMADPAAFYKDMLGWNRRALRIILPVGATPAQVAAVEDLCALSARGWTSTPAPS